MNTEIDKLIKFYGSQVNTARALSVGTPTVNGWVKGTHGISAINALLAERLTGGQIKADLLQPKLQSIA